MSKDNINNEFDDMDVGYDEDKDNKKEIKRPSENKNPRKRNMLEMHVEGETKKPLKHPKKKPVQPGSNNTARNIRPQASQRFMSDQDNIIDSDYEPVENNSGRKSPLVEIQDEQFVYDDFNSTVVEDETIDEMNKEDKKAEEKSAKKVKLKSILKKVIPVVVVLAIAVPCGLVAYKISTSDKGVDFVEVDIEAYKSTKEKPKLIDDISDQNKEAQQENGDTPDTPVSNTVADPVTVISGDDAQKIGDYLKYDLKVSAQVDGSESYNTYDTAMYAGISNILVGYDNIKDLIDEYNEKSDSKLSIDPSKFNDEITIAAIEAEIKYREDYPKHQGSDKVYEIPELNVGITGTYVNEGDDQDYSEYLVVNDGDDISAYNMPKITNMYIVPKSISIVDGYKYVWIVQLPKGLSGDNYNINLDVKYNNEEKTVTYKGKDI